MTQSMKVGHSVTGKPLPPNGLKTDAKLAALLDKNTSKYTAQFKFGNEEEAEYDIPKKWAPNSQLVRLAETLKDRALTETELASFDLMDLVGLSCQIVTEIQRGVGGKPRCVVMAVLPAQK